MLTLSLLGNQNVDSLFGVLTQWSGLKVQPFCLDALLFLLSMMVSTIQLSDKVFYLDSFCSLLQSKG